MYVCMHCTIVCSNPVQGILNHSIYRLRYKEEWDVWLIHRETLQTAYTVYLQVWCQYQSLELVFPHSAIGI